MVHSTHMYNWRRVLTPNSRARASVPHLCDSSRGPGSKQAAAASPRGAGAQLEAPAGPRRAAGPAAVKPCLDPGPGPARCSAPGFAPGDTVAGARRAAPLRLGNGQPAASVVLVLRGGVGRGA